MENNEIIIYKNTTVFNDSIADRYVKSMMGNFKLTIGFVLVMLAICLIMAVTDYWIAWIPVGLLIICAGFLSFLNLKGFKNARAEFSKFNGATYSYEFYDNHVLVNYSFNGKTDNEDILYSNIRNYSYTEGLLVVVFTNNNMIFVDEKQSDNPEDLKKIVGMIQNLMNSKNQKGKKKNK